MRGHVVQTFGFVDVALAVFGRDFLEKIFKVRLDVGIGVLLNDQRGRGVAAENRQEPGRDILLAKRARYLRANLDKTFAAGLNVQAVERLAHRKGRGLEAVAMRPAATYRTLKSQGPPSSCFYIGEREVRSAQALPRKCRTATRRAKKSHSGRYLFFTFPRLRVTWGDLGIGAPRGTGRVSGLQPRLLFALVV